jgi:hypothetical protein
MRDYRWQRRAVQLARARTPFVLTNFDATRAGGLYFALRKRFSMRTSVDFELDHAYFDPKPPAD